MILFVKFKIALQVSTLFLDFFLAYFFDLEFYQDYIAAIFKPLRIHSILYPSLSFLIQKYSSNMLQIIF